MTSPSRKRKLDDVDFGSNFVPSSVKQRTVEESNRLERQQTEDQTASSEEWPAVGMNQSGPSLSSSLSEHAGEPMMSNSLFSQMMLPHTGVMMMQVQQQLLENPQAVAEKAFSILSTCEDDIPLYLYSVKTVKSALQCLQQRDPSAVVDLLMDTMERYIASCTVQVEVMKELQGLIKTTMITQSQGARDNSDRISLLFTSLATHPNHATLQGIGLDLIRRLKGPDALQSDWLFGARIIMYALKRFPAVASIQQISLSLVAWLCEDATCRQVIIEEDGAEAIPVSMSLHMQDAFLQCNAAAALCWLVHAGGLEERPQLDPRYMVVVVDVMAYHLENASTLGNCVCLLSGLTDMAFEDEAFEIVLLGMQRHLTASKVQEGCLHWIRFRNVHVNQARWIHAIPTILSSMAAHAHDAHLQAQACDVIAGLCDSEPLKRALLQAGAPQVILSCIQQHSLDRQLQQAALWCMTLMIPATEPATAAFGGGFRVIEALWKRSERRQQTGTTVPSPMDMQDQPRTELVHGDAPMALQDQQDTELSHVEAPAQLSSVS